MRSSKHLPYFTQSTSHRLGDFVHQRNRPICLIVISEHCGHCQAMKPSLQELSHRLSRISSSSKRPSAAVVDSAAINASGISALRNVTSVPSVMIVSHKSGKSIKDYQGDRSASDLYSFIKRGTSKPQSKSKRRRNKPKTKKSKTKKSSRSTRNKTSRKL